MKHLSIFKITAAIALAACTIAPLASTTCYAAATAQTVTIKDEMAESGKTEHTYDVYRIFTGEASEGKLSQIEFAGDNFTAFLAALKEDETNVATDTTLGSLFTAADDVLAVANVLAGFAEDSVKAKAFAEFVVKNNGKVETVATEQSNGFALTEDGYYVIVDNSKNSTDHSNYALTEYLLAVYDASEGAEITAKSAVPSVVKKVKEDTSYTGKYSQTKGDNTYESPEGFNDTADHSIGDTVPFELIGTLPSNIDEFDTYQYIFHDQNSTAFTPNDDIVVKIQTDGTTYTVDTASYTATVNGTDGTITVDFDNILSATYTPTGSTSTKIPINKDSFVIVDYTTVLDDSAVLNRPGQEGSVYLEYSNNPNVVSSGTGASADTTSYTPVDEVIVFTYGIDVKKVDDDGEDLAGAKFALYIEKDSTKYYAKTDANSKIEDWIPGSFGTDGTFSPSTDKNSLYGKSVTSNDMATLTNSTEFKFLGLDAGDYKLQEVIAPTGYQKIDDLDVKIVANTNNTQDDNDITGDELTELKLTSPVSYSCDDLSQNAQNPYLSFDVENSQSFLLPATGGIGTKLFLIAGCSMVLVAGLYLITKKRAENMS